MRTWVSGRGSPCAISSSRVRVSGGDSAPGSISRNAVRSRVIPRARGCRSATVSMHPTAHPVLRHSASSSTTASWNGSRRPRSKAVRAGVVAANPRDPAHLFGRDSVAIDEDAVGWSRACADGDLGGNVVVEPPRPVDRRRRTSDDDAASPGPLRCRERSNPRVDPNSLAQVDVVMQAHVVVAQFPSRERARGQRPRADERCRKNIPHGAERARSSEIGQESYPQVDECAVVAGSSRRLPPPSTLVRRAAGARRE